MPRFVLAAALTRRLIPPPPGELALQIATTTLAAGLEQLFAVHPTLRGYLLDEHGAVRHHVAVFVDGQAIADKRALDVPLSAAAEVYIVQALSGG